MAAKTKLLTVCTADTKKVCAGMKFALDNQAANETGMFIGMQINLKTGDSKPVFYYRTTKGRRLLALNLCPWCGETLRKEK